MASEASWPRSNTAGVLVSFALAGALIAALACAFEPRWETNDDVSMAMAAHGYGVAAYGTPNLIFSNVLWGYLVRALPTLNGVSGYSLATLGVLVAVAWSMLHFLRRLGTGYLVGLLAVALLIARPTLFPQFTINAGLLAAAAVVGLRAYERGRSPATLLATGCLAFAGYLIRKEEFFLVMVIALPLLPWRALRDDRRLHIAGVLLVAAIGAAAFLDHRAYSGPEWRRYLELDAVLVKYVDFGAINGLRQRPEILARHGFSMNDVDLFHHFFVVDPRIGDASAWRAMLDEMNLSPLRRGGVPAGIASLKALLHPAILPLALAGGLLAAFARSWRAAIAWALCIGVLFGIGMMGRPGVLRVYMPLLGLLLVAPFFETGRSGTVRQWAIVAVLTACLALNAYRLVPEATASDRLVHRAQKDLARLPAGTIVTWAEAFPYEYAYPVLADIRESRDIRIYSVEPWTYAPFMLAAAEETAGRGVIERLRGAEGMLLAATRAWMPLLDIYCRTRLGGKFESSPVPGFESMDLQRVRCQA